MNEDLKEKLFDNKKNGWISTTSEDRHNIFDFAEGYMNFLNNGKTEREFVKMAKKLADENGYKDILEFETLKPSGFMEKKTKMSKLV